MKKFKRLGALFVALCMLLSMTAFAAGATGAIVLTIGSPTMSVNGTAKTIDAEGSRASLYKGNTMLPLLLRGGEYGRYRVMECFYKANCHEV